MSNTLCSAGPALQSSLPATFAERGVAVPFTTPKLSSARVRPSRRDGFDLIVPNPSGGRGQYIVPWGSLRSLYAPTVFDTLLLARFGQLRPIDPTTVRQVVLEVASEGTAGRPARAAAEAALAAETRALHATHITLLRRLVHEVEPADAAAPMEREQPGDLHRRAQRAVLALAAKLRLETSAIMTALETLARQFAAIGLGEQAQTARLPVLLASLAHMREELALDSNAASSSESGRFAAPIAILIDSTLVNARTNLADARNQALKLVEWLIAWRADPAGAHSTLSRTDWLLDGWDRVCRVWFGAPSLSERMAALQQALPLIPVMPQEVAAWPGMAGTDHPALPASPATHEDWRTGAGLLDEIARNEALLSMA